jgi:fumarylpyruvate hydrolase
MNEALEPEAIAVGLDLTDREAQAGLRAEQLPWAKAKCFRASAVVGSWSPWSGGWDGLVDPQHGLHLTLSVNNVVRQSSPLHEMSVTPAQQISALRSWAPVQSGDLLFTGTPQGVGQLFPGDAVHATIVDGQGRVLSELTTRCE